jgi:protein SCO1/2
MIEHQRRAAPGGRSLTAGNASMNLALLLLFAVLGTVPAAAQEVPGPGRAEALPDDLEGVGIEEHLDAALPLDTVFTDELGREVTLRQYFDGERPVILNLGYYSCPMLCGLVLNGLVDAMQKLSWTCGEDYRVVTLSIDPTETHTLASLKKANAVRELGRPEAAAGWCFLTGREEPIHAVSDTAGFMFRWNEKRQQYAHAAALIVCTPDGRVSRYLYGIQFDPQTLRLSLVEAADGKAGSSFDRLLLYCFHYDAEEGRYGPEARNLMKAGGLVTVLLLGGILTGFWRRERRRSARAGRGTKDPGGTEGS